MQTAGLAGAAQVLQSRGRGDDSMLVHMTPGEVGGLQSLALASGGSLTINPDTGLPEAGWLGDLLPTILGVAGSFIGIPPMLTAALVGGVTGIAKGDLKDGLMAGLGAYTGASITSGISASGGLSNMLGTSTAAVPGAAVPGATTAASLGGTGAASLGSGAGAASLGGIVPAGTAVTDASMRAGLEAAGRAVPAAATSFGGTAAQDTAMRAILEGGQYTLPAAVPGAGAAVVPPQPNFLGIDGTGSVWGDFTQGAQNFWSGTPTNEGNVGQNIMGAFRGETDPSKIAAYGLGDIGTPELMMGTSIYDTANRVDMSLQPSYGSWGDEEEEEEYPYEGPYLPTKRNYIPRGEFYTQPGPLGRDSSEHQWFDDVNPVPEVVPSNPVPESSYSIFTPEEQRRFAAAERSPFDEAWDRQLEGVKPKRPANRRFAEGGRVPRRASSERQWVDNATSISQTPSNPIGIMLGESPRLPVGAVASTPLPTAGLSIPNIRSAERDYGFGDLSRNTPIDMPAERYTVDAPPFIETLDSPPVGQMGTIYRGAGLDPNNHSGRPSIIGFGKRDWEFNDFAAGGVNLPDGAFVMDARTVSELGNGSSGAGQEMLAGLGGIPIRGSGDGVSDTIRANVGGTQEARVSRGEVKFNPRAVSRMGGGSHTRGTDKLYNLMDRARQARRRTRRGASNGLEGLA